MLAIADTGESSEARPTLRAHFAAVGGHASRNYVRCGSDSAIGWPRDTTASPPVADIEIDLVVAALGARAKSASV